MRVSLRELLIQFLRRGKVSGEKLNLRGYLGHFAKLIEVAETSATNLTSRFKLPTQQVKVAFCDRALGRPGLQLDGAIIGPQSPFVIDKPDTAIPYLRLHI